MEWLTNDWYQLIPRPWAHVALSIVAVICGAIVGTEREKKEKPAGLRTLILVCVGSAAFTMVSYAFGTTTGDTGRVAAQIVTGIGFIGTGVILHGQSEVSGLTTAATVWATAAMGMAIGVGYAGAGLGYSLLMRGVLSGLYWWERFCVERNQLIRVELLIDLDHGKTRCHLQRLMDRHHLGTKLGLNLDEVDGVARLELEFRLPQRQAAEFLDELAAMPTVHEIRRFPP